MQRLIDEHAEKIIESDDFISYVYKNIHHKIARDVPFSYFQSHVNNITDFREIMQVAEELEKNYKKIENSLNEII